MTEVLFMTVSRPALLALLLGAHFAQADENVTIRGYVIAEPPCVINNGMPIRARFGDVQIEHINGSYKTIPIEFVLKCNPTTTANELRMQLVGVHAFDGLSLAIPGYSDVAIAITKDGRQWPITEWSNFDLRWQPVLKAVLVKRYGRKIKPGEFTASATMVVDYR
jgi:type 1 fimbria pilin